jgi:hypothetical protein
MRFSDNAVLTELPEPAWNQHPWREQHSHPDHIAYDGFAAMNNPVLQALALGVICVIYAIKGAIPVVSWLVVKVL